MQFESFHWLSHHGLWAIIPCSTNMESICMSFWAFLSLFKSTFYILGAFLIKQLFHPCLLDMRRLKPTQRYVPCWLSIISYTTCFCGIIDNYSLPNKWMIRDPNNNKMAGENLCSTSVSETEILRIQEDTVPENTKKSSKFWIFNFSISSKNENFDWTMKLFSKQTFHLDWWFEQH